MLAAGAGCWDPEPTGWCSGSRLTKRIQALRHPSSVRGNVSTGVLGDCRSQMAKLSATNPSTYRKPECVYWTAPAGEAAGELVVELLSPDEGAALGGVPEAEAPVAWVPPDWVPCCIAVSVSTRRSLKQYR